MLDNQPELPFSEFMKQFQPAKKFWKAVRRSIVPFSEDDTEAINNRRREYLLDLHEKIQKGQFASTPPREILLQEKHNGVPRFIHALSLQDVCVYYFCMLNLEADVLAGRATNTFAGWSQGGEVRILEQKELNETPTFFSDNSEYSFTQVLNPIRNRVIWQEYRRAVLTSATRLEHNYFVRLDIANFYDNIDLDYLERLLRIAVDGSRQKTVDLLLSFLRTWNRTGGQYAMATRGLPTEEIGDSSRLFANFYIQSYDHAMQRHCEDLGSNASYFRFADDQWIMTTERQHAERLIIRAAEELRKLGLSINSSKVLQIGSMEDFLFYWGHDVFEPLDVVEAPDIVAFADRALSLLDNADSIRNPWRRESIENALLERIHHPTLPVDYRNRIFGIATHPSKIKVLDNRVMSKIYRAVDQSRQRDFSALLDHCRSTYPFNFFHYHHDRFIERTLS